jgi:hypothetical protein
MLKIFFILYIINLILDYPLQGDFLATYKSKNNYVLYVHSMIWAGGLSLVLMYLGIFAIWKLLMLLIGHMLIDAWKCRGYYKKLHISDWNSLYIDQGLHVGQLLLCLL